MVSKKKKTMRKPGARPRQILGNLVEISKPTPVRAVRFSERETENGGIKISAAALRIYKGTRGIAVDRVRGGEYRVLIDGGLWQISSKYFDVVPPCT